MDQLIPHNDQIVEALKWSTLNDWGDENDISAIIEHVGQLKPGQVYLEVGVAFGASMALACLAAGLGVELHGIDIIDWKDRDDRIRRFMNKLGWDEREYFFHPGDSQMIAKTWTKKVDVLYLDGDHTALGVAKDLASWIPHLNNGAVIIFDDYNDKTGVKNIVDSILLNNNLFTSQTIWGETFTCRYDR